MTIYYEMPDNIWNGVQRVINTRNGKIFLLDKTSWYNALTRTKQEVRNIPLWANSQTGDYPRAINTIRVQLVNEKEDKSTEDLYIFNEYYSHINLSSSKDDETFYSDSDVEKVYIEDGVFISSLFIEWQNVCAPIKMNHFYTKDLKELALIFKGQLMGQNSGSSFQNVCYVDNGKKDSQIKDSNGMLIKKSAPIVQLLTRLPLDTLRNDTEAFRQYWEALCLPQSDDEVMIKPKERNCYVTVTKADLESRDPYGISNYYPVITYQKIKDLNLEFPRQEMDLACLGLGSAGTGILDQIVRGTYINSYLLCDFDRVEEKNLRNQWYTNGDKGCSKTYASEIKLKNQTPRELTIKTKDTKFQEAKLDSYKFKYMISGFDSISARQELLDYIKQGIVETSYLIDVRYDDLNASIYFIDTADTVQMDYYEQCLKEDGEAFDKSQKYVTTWEEFFEILKKEDTFTHNCLESKMKYLGVTHTECKLGTSCAGSVCQAYWKQQFEEHAEKIKAMKIPALEESSCIKQNFIDIYKYSSTFVFAAIREIEDGNAKPFTHIEAQTSVVPNHMILKK